MKRNSISDDEDDRIEYQSYMETVTENIAKSVERITFAVCTTSVFTFSIVLQNHPPFKLSSAPFMVIHQHTHPHLDFRAVSTYETSYSDHRTGRKCSVKNCSGALHDTIINFGEDLPEAAFTLATQHAKKADLCLVLGSSCRVTPANGIPETVGRGKKGRLAICNLQDTPLEDVADRKLRVYTRTDELMTGVMAKLGIAIPPFVLRRRLVVGVAAQGRGRQQVQVAGVDVDGTPVSFLKEVRLEGARRALRTEPFVASVREEVAVGAVMRLELEFMGHYGEPGLVVEHVHTEADGEGVYLLEYDVWTRTWEVKRL